MMLCCRQIRRQHGARRITRRIAFSPFCARRRDGRYRGFANLFVLLCTGHQTMRRPSFRPSLRGIEMGNMASPIVHSSLHEAPDNASSFFFAFPCVAPRWRGNVGSPPFFSFFARGVRRCIALLFALLCAASRWRDNVAPPILSPFFARGIRRRVALLFSGLLFTSTQPTAVDYQRGGAEK